MTPHPTVLITGASRGIGRALAREFHDQGATVWGVSRTPVEAPCVDRWLEADVATPSGRERICAEMRAGIPLDVLVNNAGRGIQEPWETMNETDLRAVMELNFYAPVLLTQSLLPVLRLTHGTVINVSSAAGRVGIPCMGGYCASKSALSAFSESLCAEELAPQGVRVLDLVVGRIATTFGHHVLGSKEAPSTPAIGSAERLAKITYKAYRDKRRVLVFPWWYRPAICAARLLPGLFARRARNAWGLSP